MKRKIGTVVDDSLYHSVKVLAAQERRPVAEVVEIALTDYVERARRKHPLQSGLARFLAAPELSVTNEHFRESMELDFFDQ